MIPSDIGIPYWDVLIWVIQYIQPSLPNFGYGSSECFDLLGLTCNLSLCSWRKLFRMMAGILAPVNY